MSRDSNGNYTLPAGNPVVSGEVISTSWANPTMSDIAAEITNSLDRNGRGGMLAPFKNVDGTQSNPGMTWGNEPTTGFYRNAAQDMRAVVGGFPRMRWDANGTQLWNGTIWSPVVTDATLDTALAAKGYAVKAANETISGQWTFSPLTTFSNQIKVGPGAASPSAYILVNAPGSQGANIQLFRDGVSSWIIGSTPASGDFIFQESSVEKFRISGGGAAVTGNFSVSALLSGLNATFTGALKGGSVTVETPNAAQLVFAPGSGNQAQLIYPATSTFVIRDTADRFTIAAGDGTFAGSFAVGGNLNVAGTLKRANVDVVLTNQTITGVNTVQGGGDLSANRTFQLVNDVAAPGSSWYYGTDAAGAKGWFPLSGVVGVPEAPIDGTAYARQNASWVSIGSGGVYVLKTGDTMTGELKFSHVYPSIGFNQTDGGVNEKNMMFVQDAQAFEIRYFTDDYSSYTVPINLQRSGTQPTAMVVTATNSYLVGSGTHIGSGASYVPVASPANYLGVVSSGMAEVGVYGDTGTTMPRVALYAGAGVVGLDWTYNTGVSFFEFKRAGATHLRYNNTQFDVLGLTYYQYSPDISKYFSIGVDNSGGVVFNAGSGGPIDLTISGTPRLSVQSSGVNIYFGLGLNLYNADNTIVGTILQDAGTLTFRGSGAMGFDVGGSRYFDLSAGALNMYNGLPIRYYGPGNSGFLQISKQNGYSEINEGSGNPVIHYINSVNVFETRSDGIYIRGAKQLALFGGGDGTFTSLYNDASSGKGVLKVTSNTGARGGVLHWLSSGLYDSTIDIVTSTPGATGTPGVMVLVYE